MRVVFRTLGALLIGAGLIGFVSTGASGQSDQDSTPPEVPNGFILSASAVALGVQVIGATLPLAPGGEDAFLSPASTQSYLDSTRSNGYASAPFPGNFIISLPTTVDGLTSGSFPPIPSYPFYVASTDPTTPTAGDAVGPYQISASSNPTASSGDAKIGLSTSSPQVASTTSLSSVSRDPTTGIAEAVQASTEIAPLQLNSILSLGDVNSSVTLTYDPSNPTAGVTEKDSFSVGTVTIAGVQLGLTSQGLTLPGGVKIPLNLSALQKLLAATGLSIQYLPLTRTATSLTSAGVEVSFNKTLPTAGNTTVNIVLGQVSATLNPGTAVPSSPETDVVAPLPSDQSTSLGGGLPTSLPIASGVTPTTSAPSAAGQTPVRGPQTQILGFIPAHLNDVSLLYLSLALAGLLALVGSRLTQWIAFKLRLVGRQGPGV